MTAPYVGEVYSWIRPNQDFGPVQLSPLVRPEETSKKCKAAVLIGIVIGLNCKVQSSSRAESRRPW